MCLQVVEVLHEYGIKFIAMRCAGFDKVDVEKLNELDMKVGKPDVPIAHAEQHGMLLRSSCCRLQHSTRIRSCSSHETLWPLAAQVARVPTYSPESVAEHSVALAMSLNRCAAHLAWNVKCRWGANKAVAQCQRSEWRLVCAASSEDFFTPAVVRNIVRAHNRVAQVRTTRELLQFPHVMVRTAMSCIGL